MPNHNYPALFAFGNITIDDESYAELKSSADAGLWDKGDLTLKGRLSLYSEGVYASGCMGDFKMEEAYMCFIADETTALQMRSM